MPTDEYEDFERFIDVLPSFQVVPCYPFSGFVINFNASTLVHRDGGDQGFCVIVTFADAEGGGLGLKEPGLVIRTKPKTLTVTLIRSNGVTHFNKHFIGRRLSLVFHSDRYAKRWVADRNGWGSNNHMRTVWNHDSEPYAQPLED